MKTNDTVTKKKKGHTEAGKSVRKGGGEVQLA